MWVALCRVAQLLRDGTPQSRKWTDLAYPNRTKMDEVPAVDISAARDGSGALARVASETGAAARDIGFFSVAMR